MVDSLTAISSAVSPVSAAVIGAVVGAVFGGGLTFLIFRHRDKKRERISKAEAARELVAPATPILESLNHTIRSLNDAELNGRQALIGFLTERLQLLGEADFEDLSSAARQASRLDLPCYRAWRDARQGLDDLQKKHRALRGLVGVPSVEDELGPGLVAYRRLLEGGIGAMISALRATRAYGDNDTKTAIGRLAGED